MLHTQPQQLHEDMDVQKVEFVGDGQSVANEFGEWREENPKIWILRMERVSDGDGTNIQQTVFYVKTDS